MATNDAVNSIYLPIAGGTVTARVIFNSPADGFIGTTAADDASAGTVGEFIFSINNGITPINMTTATPADIVSISLTAGDWNVWGGVFFDAGAGTLPTTLQSGISTVSATMPDNARISVYQFAFLAGGNNGIVAPMQRVNISSTATYYMVGSATFTVSTLVAYGGIFARRMR